MFKVHIGIDPGLTGALCAQSRIGQEYILEDLPVFEYGKVKWIDGLQFIELLRRARLNHASAECFITLELTQAMAKNGTIAANSMGRTLGSMLSVIQISGIPFEIVAPARWKRRMDLVGKDKEFCRAKARMLFPWMCDSLDRKKDHNRAEAALLGYYGMTQESLQGAP
jgi:crossover junction endodeoxyribonuclease RuvC